jgi:hypothetical protein
MAQRIKLGGKPFTHVSQIKTERGWESVERHTSERAAASMASKAAAGRRGETEKRVVPYTPDSDPYNPKNNLLHLAPTDPFRVQAQQEFDADVARRHALQHGARGGEYYVTNTGHKVYIK